MKEKFIQLANAFINADNDQTRFERKVELNGFIGAVKINILDTKIESLKKRSVIDSVNNYNATETNKILLIKLFEGFQNLIID